MAVVTKRTIKTIPVKRARNTATTGSTKPSTTKPAPRPRAAKAAAPAAAKPVRKRAPASAKVTTTAAKKTAARPPVVKKPTLTKKVTHQPLPFVAVMNKKGKPAKVKKPKLVRDSFTMPDGEYALISILKKRCLNAGVAAKKSEILRAAVANLAKLSDASVVAAVRRLEVIKTGRPTKGSK